MNRIVSLRKSLVRSTKKFIRRLSLPSEDFSIISNDCWGGFVSQHFGLPYRSPFVGLCVYAPDYLVMLRNLEHYMKAELTMIEAPSSKFRAALEQRNLLGKYPVGKLDDIEIHFFHYKDSQEALEKWNRRVSRINYSNLIVKFSDGFLATEELIAEFDRLPFRSKICCTAKRYPWKSCLRLKNETGESVTDEWRNFMLTVNPRQFMRQIQNDATDWSLPE